jgi:hypothetical protein
MFGYHLRGITCLSARTQLLDDYANLLRFSMRTWVTLVILLHVCCKRCAADPDLCGPSPENPLPIFTTLAAT